MVALASDVGVLVIVWTLIGASPPTGTEPTIIWRDLRRSISRHGRMDMRRDIRLRRPAANLNWRFAPDYPLVLTRLTDSLGGGRCRSLPSCRQMTARRKRLTRTRGACLGSSRAIS